MNSHTGAQSVGHLTSDKRALLQNAIVEHGSVVDYGQLRALLPERQDGEVRRIVSQLAQAGWLVRIKKGLYEIADLGSLGSLTLSRYVVAGLLLPDSYISDENALQYHGHHDQLMRSVLSVARTRHAPVDVYGTTYHYTKVQENFFFGFDEVRLDGQTARIAQVEKALIDMIQLRRSDYAVDRVGEVLATENAVDRERLNAYLMQSALPTQRIFGFMQKTLNLPVDERLVAQAQSSQSVTRLTHSSTVRDACWRLYYDPDLVNRIQSYL